MKRKRTIKGGFTLVETMLALAIIAAGGLAVSSTFVTAKSLQSDARAISDAGDVAGTVLECFRKMPYIVLEEGVPAGEYDLEDLTRVYDADDEVYDVIDSALMNRLRWNLDTRHMEENITVEQGYEAMRVSIAITKDGDETPLVRSTAFIAKNGINFR